MALQNKVSSENTHFCPTCANPIAPTLHNAPILQEIKLAKQKMYLISMPYIYRAQDKKNG